MNPRTVCYISSLLNQDLLDARARLLDAAESNKEKSVVLDANDNYRRIFEIRQDFLREATKNDA